MGKSYDYILYTDGGCAVNPGGPGGYGSVLINCETEEKTELSAGYFSSTNNRMEIMAAIAGMESIPKGSTVLLYADSQYVLRTISGEYRKKKNQDLWARLDAAMEDKIVTTSWVKGHDGNHYNERCDQLATEAMQCPTLADTGYTESKTVNVEKAEEKHVEKDVEIPKKHLYYKGEIKSINSKCKDAIQKMNDNPKPSFKDFCNLKTGGLDDWSNVSDFDGLVSNEVQDIVKKHIPGKVRAKACLRWYGRGLRLDYAIRKVLVDAEVAANASGTAKGKKDGQIS